MVEKPTQLRVNINTETAQALRVLSFTHAVSLTETIRRAVGVYKFVSDEIRKGNRVQVVDRNGRDTKEVVLWD